MSPQPDPPRPIPLGPGDAAACDRLDQSCLGGLWSQNQWSRELADPGSTVLGLRQSADPEANALIALACGQTVVDEFHLTAVAVAPAWRRRGLARMLLQALLAEARQRGCLRATLEVDGSNAAAVRLYGDLGFRTEGIRRAYYRNGGDALIQWVDL